jgi:hypothetical protein
MAISLKEITTSKDFKTFIFLPDKIHKGDANWLPPLYDDEKKYFNPQKNPSFRSCDYRMVLAYKGNEAVGRIVGIINHKHNEMLGLKNARFGFLDCYNDREVAHALISDIEQWGKQRGMNKIVGPFGFSDRDIQGLLVEGFEYEPVIDSACNPAYLPDLVVGEGYIKDIDCVIYRYPLDKQLPDVFDKMYKRMLARKTFHFLEFSSRKAMKPYVVPVLRLVNESFSGIYGFVPMDETEMFDLAKRYMFILDPKFVKIVLRDGNVVGFLVSMPNCYRGIQKARGRLLPFGLFRILHAMRHAASVNTMLGAVHPSCQKLGLDLFLGLSTIETARKAGMTSVDTHVVMEENDSMMHELRRYGAHLIKKFRVYQKPLS